MKRINHWIERAAAPNPSRPALVGEVVVAFGLLFVYDKIRSLSYVGRLAAVRRGLAILAAEGSLGFEDRFNGWMAARRTLSMAAVSYYQFLHIGAAAVVLGWCYVHRPDVYRRGRTALVVTNVIGLMVFERFPVAPPRLLPGAIFDDVVANAGYGTSHGPIPMDAYAAMPSLHLAWAVCVALTGIAASRRLGSKTAFALHPLITAVVVVGTGNHYLADVIVGSFLGLAAFVVPAAVSQWAVERSSVRVGEGAGHSLTA